VPVLFHHEPEHVGPSVLRLRKCLVELFENDTNVMGKWVQSDLTVIDSFVERVQIFSECNRIIFVLDLEMCKLI
jgi:hypothetical protein